jgi:predicted HTH transcriptional regulator
MSKHSNKKESFDFSILGFLFAALFVVFLFFFLKRKPCKKISVKNEEMPDLNSRQKKVLEELSLKGEITVEELMESIQGVSERTFRRDMLKLEKLGFSKKQGNTKGSKYIYTK